MLPTTKIIEREIAAAGLRLIASEFFGESYARTLGEWQRRFQRAWPAIEALGFDDRLKRTGNTTLLIVKPVSRRGP